MLPKSPVRLVRTIDAHPFVPSGQEQLAERCGEIFHAQVRKVYQGNLDWAVNKRAEQMAHVVYDAPHENLKESGDRRGRGKDFATWIFSEEPGLKENLFSTRFELASALPIGAIYLRKTWLAAPPA